MQASFQSGSDCETLGSEIFKGPWGTIIALAAIFWLVAVGMVAPGMVAPARAASHALVIGIDKYQNITGLQKATGDARAMAAALQKLGYNVETLLDPPRRKINLAVSALARKVQPGDTVFFHFSGHGIRVDGQNFLLPADVPGADDSGGIDFVVSEAIRLDSLIDRLKRTGAKVNLFVIDACRNNPYQNTRLRAFGQKRGLTRIEPPKGTFVMFSAGIGQQALDRLSNNDPDQTSVFTRTLLRHMQRRNLSLMKLASTVRREVEGLARQVRQEQRPAFYDGMNDSSRYSIASGVIEAAVKPAPVQDRATQAKSAPSSTQTGLSEREAYQIARDVDTVEAWQAFLKKFPNGERTVFVEARIRKLVAARKAREQADRDKAKAVRDKAERERQARLERDRQERERQARLERDRQERERQAQLERDRQERERQARLERDRQARERQARLERERQERERLARLQAEEQRRWQDTRDHTTPPASCQTQTHGPWRVTRVPSNDVLNIRRGPGTRFAIVGSIPPNGTGVGKSRCLRNGWCFVRYKCASGWASGKYLAQQWRPSHDRPDPSATLYRVIDHRYPDRLNIRRGPGTRFAIIGSIPHNGVNVRVYRCRRVVRSRNPWCVVSYNGIRGWASGRYLANMRTGARPRVTARRQSSIEESQQDSQQFQVPVIGNQAPRFQVPRFRNNVIGNNRPNRPFRQQGFRRQRR